MALVQCVLLWLMAALCVVAGALLCGDPVVLMQRGARWVAAGGGAGGAVLGAALVVWAGWRMREAAKPGPRAYELRRRE